MLPIGKYATSEELLELGENRECTICTDEHTAPVRPPFRVALAVPTREIGNPPAAPSRADRSSRVCVCVCVCRLVHSCGRFASSVGTSTARSASLPGASGTREPAPVHSAVRPLFRLSARTPTARRHYFLRCFDVKTAEQLVTPRPCHSNLVVVYSYVRRSTQKTILSTPCEARRVARRPAVRHDATNT